MKKLNSGCGFYVIGGLAFVAIVVWLIMLSTMDTRDKPEPCETEHTSVVSGESGYAVRIVREHESGKQGTTYYPAKYGLSEPDDSILPYIFRDLPDTIYFHGRAASSTTDGAHYFPAEGYAKTPVLAVTMTDDIRKNGVDLDKEWEEYQASVNTVESIRLFMHYDGEFSLDENNYRNNVAKSAGITRQELTRFMRSSYGDSLLYGERERYIVEFFNPPPKPPSPPTQQDRIEAKLDSILTELRRGK